MASKAKRVQAAPVEVAPPEPVHSQLLTNLLATPVEEYELLACANHRDTGVLAKLSRHQLQQLCNEGGFVVAPYTVEGTNLPTEEVLRIARFTVSYAQYANTDPTKFDLAKRRDKYTALAKSILDNHNARLTAAAAKTNARQALRSASAMSETNAAETTAPKHEGKATATKGAAKKTPAKAPAKTAAKTATKAPAKSAKKAEGDGEESTASRYASDVRKIKVLNKENPSREGTGRYNAFEECKKAKTVADYAATGSKPKYLQKWVDAGLIELVG